MFELYEIIKYSFKEKLMMINMSDKIKSAISIADIILYVLGILVCVAISLMFIAAGIALVITYAGLTVYLPALYIYNVTGSLFLSVIGGIILSIISARLFFHLLEFSKL